MDAADPLALGRRAYADMAWRDACEHLSAADEQHPLAAADLDLLGKAAYLIGRAEAGDRALERAHRAHLGTGEVAAAVRCAFWLGFALHQRREHARGGGWMARAQRLLDDSAADCVERGYLQVPAALDLLRHSRGEEAYRILAEAAALADRFGDPDLMALVTLGQGQALIVQGLVPEGVAMLDEAMLAVATGEVSPIPAGIVYCAVILACRDVFDVRRVQEWTAALSRWCAAQQDLRLYRGQCMVHRSEIMQLRGEWADAMNEARQACEHAMQEPVDPAAGMALYQQAELLRLGGEFAQAEACYREASGFGHPVQPGLALMRLAQGRVEDAHAAIVVTAAETRGPVDRAKILAAFVEIKLAVGEIEPAREALGELETSAAGFDSPYLRALTGSARGAVLLAEGDAVGACAVLREAWTAWHEIGAMHEAARARLLIARSCAAAGDDDTARMELDAARRVFAQLGAAPDLERVRELAGGRTPDCGLTPREVEVLRLVATGATNRQIAETLVISDKTVARHLSNMFTKLGLTSRAAATAYAYEHDLV
jgi:DNA-binding CsgD family transcriptional regulator